MRIKREGYNIVTFSPEGEGEFEWLQDTTNAEPYQWLGHTLAVDTRYAGNLIEAAQNAGWDIDLN